jgi:hypothetical protein
MAKRFKVFKNKYLRLISLILAAIVIGGSLLWVLNPQSASAVWYDDSYGYREKITIGNTGSADSSKKVKLDIDTATLITAGKLQSDCDDTRFTDINGKLLKYYVDSAGGACNGASTDYYVLLNTINSGDTIIYMYHGNASATAGTQAAQFAESTFAPTSGPTVGSEEKGTPPVLSWKFDEGSGTTTQDSSSNNNDGTTSGPTWRTEDVCISGKCLLFDDNDDYVSRAYSSDTDLDVGTSSFSVSLWFKHPNSTGSTDVLLSRFSGAGYILYMNTTGNICFGIDDDGSAFPEDGICTTESYYDIKWHFVEAVKSGTSSITLYVDGKQKAQDTSISASGSLSGSSPTLFVGGEGIASNLWDGFIDEVRIYNYAKSSAQVLADYNSRAANQSTAITFGSSTADTSLTQSLVGYWKMDETAADSCTGGANDACDSSGNRNDMVITNNVSFTSGKFANAASFDGADDALGDSISGLTGMKRWTVSSWFKTSDTNAYIFDTRNGDNDGAAVFSDGATTLSFFLTSGGTTYKYLNYTTSALDNNWHHLIATRDNDNSVSLYIDGNKLSTASTTTDVDMSAVSESWSGIVLGRRNNTDIYALSGLLDETRLYNRGFSSIEASTLYDWGPGPVGWWKMDENTGSSASDNSGNANTGTLTNSGWRPCKFGSCMKTSSDGAQDIVTITDPGSGILDFSDTQSFTYEMWVKSSSKEDATHPLRKGGTSSSVVGYYIQLDTGTTAICAYTDGNGVGGVESATSTTNVQDGNWHHISCVMDRANSTLSIYVDGKFEASDTSLTEGSAATNSNNLILGETSASREFVGGVDDARIYSYARTAKQVVQDMNAGNPAVGGVVSSAVGHWSFDEGYSTTANDKSPNDNDLTLSTSSWTNSGKFGKAWLGTAANWVTKSDDPDFDFAAADHFTLSFWYQSSSADNTGGLEYILNKEAVGTAGYAITVDNTDTLSFSIDDDSWTPDLTITDTVDTFDTSWHHIAAIKKGTASLEMYIDGRLAASTTTLTGATGSLANNASLVIGDRLGTNDGNEFHGNVDELKIYRYALSHDEIKKEIIGGTSQTLGATSTESNGTTASNSQAREYCVVGDTTSCSAPVAEWKLDERTGTTANDTSGNDFTGTLNGATSWKVGKVGPAVNFTNATGDYINVADNASLDFGASSDFTLEAWVYRTGAVEQDAIIGKKNSEDSCSSDPGYSFYITTAGLAKAWGCDSSNNSYNVESTTTLSNNTWYHIAFVWDDDSTTNTAMYINGKKDTGSTSGTLTSVGDLTNALALRIGSESDGGKNMNGSLDHIVIYNYARSPSQVAWDYNKGAPLAWLKFDECNGTTAYDATGNGFNGTITIAASGTYTAAGTCSSGTSTQAWNGGTTGKFNSALGFDGTDDYVNLGNVFKFTSSFSVAAWYYRTDTAANYVVNKLGGSGARDWSLWNDSGSPVFTVATASNTTIARYADRGDSLNQWYHYVGVYNASAQTLDFYLNGILSNSTASLTVPTSLFSSNENVRIGSRESNSSFTNGLIDDVRVYGYPLTANQIETIYNDNSALRFGPASGQP